MEGKIKKLVCPLCPEPLGEVAYTYVNCGHTICGECHEGMNSTHPSLEEDPDYGSVDYIRKGLCVFCRAEGPRKRIFLVEEVDQEAEQMKVKIQSLEEELNQLRVKERTFSEDVRPVVLDPEEASLYCVRCGANGHLAREKKCANKMTCAAAKKKLLSPGQFQKWEKKKKDDVFKKYEAIWQAGGFVFKRFYDKYHSGEQCYIRCPDCWVQKV